MKTSVPKVEPSQVPSIHLIANICKIFLPEFLLTVWFRPLFKTTETDPGGEKNMLAEVWSIKRASTRIYDFKPQLRTPIQFLYYRRIMTEVYTSTN